MNPAKEILTFLEDGFAKLGADENFYSKLLKYGHEGTITPDLALPDEIMKLMLPQACFRNAAMVALARPDLLYVEGYMTFEGLAQIPIHHAWVTPSGDRFGAVIECSPIEGTPLGYFGMEINGEQLADYQEREMCGSGLLVWEFHRMSGGSLEDEPDYV